MDLLDDLQCPVSWTSSSGEGQPELLLNLQLMVGIPSISGVFEGFQVSTFRFYPLLGHWGIFFWFWLNTASQKKRLPIKKGVNPH
jgi:hypothetical protein